jgi:predicted CoA-binding protein
MVHSSAEDELIKKNLSNAKIIAMVGVSSIKEDQPNNIKRKPSIIVMKYLQQFGYKVIPVNPFSAGKKIHGETVVANLEDIDVKVDIVDVFRPSKDTPIIAKQTARIGAKALWLQYGIQNSEAEKIVNSAKIDYIANKCIKQEYQKFFLKMSPVFPVLRNN